MLFLLYLFDFYNLVKEVYVKFNQLLVRMMCKKGS